MCQSSLKIPQATKIGWIEVRRGGVFDWSYPTSLLRRGRVQGKYGDICPTITCNPECLYVYEIIESDMVLIWDDYNSRLPINQDVIGTITPNCGTSAIRNGYKIIEITESDMTRTRLNRYVWYCYRRYEKRVGTDKAREEVSRIFDITVIEKERIKESEFRHEVIDVDVLLSVREILIEWGMWRDWMPAVIDDYTRNYREKSECIRFLSDITPIRKAIRKLTPRECLRLMDVNESDIDKMVGEGISNSQLYKMAGNSIVVSCMEGIFYNLFSNEQQNILTLF